MPEEKKRAPKDARPEVITISVSGLSIDHLMEAARAEAAKIFQVPSSRIKVQMGTVGVGSRDPFPTDLDTYAQVSTLVGTAKCVLTPDPDMPAYDQL